MSSGKVKQLLDYQSVRQEKVRFLEDHELAVLATAYGERVTARTVHYASKGLDIYFLSWEHHTKCVQIKGNPRVALCIHNLQIEGSATILGNPLSDKNREFAAICSAKSAKNAKSPNLFNDFASRPGMIIAKIMPTFMVTWVREGNRRYLEHLDLNNEIAYIFEEF